VARLIYLTSASLDGFSADGDGGFDWATPDEEVHAFVNALMRPLGTMLLGRRMYEILRYWEHVPDLDEQPQVVRDFAEIWRGLDKVVHSTSLSAASSSRTRLVSGFDPGTVRRMKSATPHDLSIGGPTLAASALRAGLVDEIHVLVHPAVLGGGLRAMPEGVQLHLRLLDQRRFASGVVHVHYACESLHARADARPRGATTSGDAD
jgi:dihydrofolate reductase